MKMKIKVIVHEAEEGDFWVEVPATPGAVLVLQLDLDDLPRRLRADLGDDIGERQRASLLERAFVRHSSWRGPSRQQPAKSSLCWFCSWPLHSAAVTLTNT